MVIMYLNKVDWLGADIQPQWCHFIGEVMQDKKRELLKAFTLGSGAVTAANLRNRWIRPVVDSVVLPADAHTTEDTSVPCSEPRLSENTQNFETPVSYTFIVPAGATFLNIVARGADGGDRTGYDGGQGVTIEVDAVSVNPCDVVTFCAGGRGELRVSLRAVLLPVATGAGTVLALAMGPVNRNRASTARYA